MPSGPVGDCPFVVGVNLPWIRYGGDFGANPWRPQGGVSQPDLRATLDATLGRLADRGLALVRWFMLCDARAGIRVDPSGMPLGPDAALLRDLDAALEALASSGVRAMFVLFDYLLLERARLVDGVQTRGRRSWIREAEARARLIEGVVRPVAAHAEGSPALFGWDLINEPEWVTRGFGAWTSHRGVPRETLRGFLGECVSGLRDVTTAPITVGLAGSGGLDLVRELGLDFYQVHWYDKVDSPSALATPVSTRGLDAALWLGEFPTVNSRQSPEAILSAARQAGYAGALAWSYCAGDTYSSGAACDEAVARWAAGPGHEGTG
jgi:hypothetical protein